MIGDVLARHRQFDRRLDRQAVRHVEEEGSQPLLRAFDEQQGMLVRPFQLGRGQRPELPRNLAITFRGLEHGRAPNQENPGIDDGLGRTCVLVAGIAPEHVAGQIETENLASAVTKDLICPHCAAQHFVDVVGGLIFSVNLGVAAKRHRGAVELDATFRLST